MAKTLSIIAKGAGFYFAGFAISKVLAYLYRVLLARGLGPEGLGVFSIGMGITGLILIFAALGLYQGIVHYVVVYDAQKKPEKVRGTVLFSMKAQLVASLIFAALLFYFSDYIAIDLYNLPELASVLKILSVVLPFTVLVSTLMMVIQAFKKIKYMVFTRNIAENIAKLLFTSIFLFFGMHLVGASIALALASVSAFIIGLYLVQKKVFPLLGKGLESSYDWRELFGYSWPLLAVGFFDLVMRSIDTLMLGYLSNAYDAGIYNVASPTANLLVVASIAFSSLFLPVMTGLYAQGKIDEFNRTFKVVTRWIFAVIFPALLFTILFAGEILSIMFGAIYAEGANALVILSLGVFMVSFVGPVKSILESIKKTKLIFFNTVFCGLLNVVLNIWLIPLFAVSNNAIVGAALATTISYVLWNVLALLEVFYFTKVHPYSRKYIYPTIAACIAAAIFYLIKVSVMPIDLLAFPLDFIVLVIMGTSFVAFYAVLFVVLKGLQPEDIDVLRALENKLGIKSQLARDLLKKFT